LYLRKLRAGYLKDFPQKRKNKVKSVSSKVKNIIKVANVKKYDQLHIKLVKDWYDYIRSDAALLNRNYIEDIDEDDERILIEVFNGNSKLTVPFIEFEKESKENEILVSSEEPMTNRENKNKDLLAREEKTKRNREIRLKRKRYINFLKQTGQYVKKEKKEKTKKVEESEVEQKEYVHKVEKDSLKIKTIKTKKQKTKNKTKQKKQNKKSGTLAFWLLAF